MPTNLEYLDKYLTEEEKKALDVCFTSSASVKAQMRWNEKFLAAKRSYRDSASDIINKLFTWLNTPQGGPYWEDVYRHIDRRSPNEEDDW